MPNTASIAEPIEIQIGMGKSFHVSAKVFWQAQRAANNTNLVHWIGNLPSGAEMISCEYDALVELGCVAICPVFPERRTPMQKFGDFVMYGPERA